MPQDRVGLFPAGLRIAGAGREPGPVCKQSRVQVAYWLKQVREQALTQKVENQSPVLFFFILLSLILICYI